MGDGKTRQKMMLARSIRNPIWRPDGKLIDACLGPRYVMGLAACTLRLVVQLTESREHVKRSLGLGVPRDWRRHQPEVSQLVSTQASGAYQPIRPVRQRPMQLIRGYMNNGG